MGRPSVINHKGPLNVEEGRRMSQLKERFKDVIPLALTMKEGTRARKCGWLLEAGEVRKQIPLDTSEGTQPC